MAHVHEYFLESLKNVVRSKVAMYLYNCDRSLNINVLFPKQFDALIACYSKVISVAANTTCCHFEMAVCTTKTLIYLGNKFQLFYYNLIS
jgi:hypothetical protein